MWGEVGCLYHASGTPASHGVAPTQPVTGLSFDPVEERLWLTDSEGFLASYVLSDCAPYSSTRVCWPATHDDPAWAITALPRSSIRPVVGASGVIMPVGSALRLYGRGGVLEADVHVAALERAAPGGGGGGAGSSASGLSVALALDAPDTRGVGGYASGKILVGGRLASNNLHLIDASRLWTGGAGAARVFRTSEASRYSQTPSVRVLQSLSVGHAVGALVASGGDGAGRGGIVVAASGDTPDLTLFDGALRSPTPTGRLAGAHPGGTLAIDATRHLVVTAGWSGGGGAPVADASVRIFDVRMGRSLSTLMVPSAGRWGGPLSVRFLPVPLSANGTPLFESPQMSIMTADGRHFVADPRSDRRLTEAGGVDASLSALRKASLRGETFVPTGENARVRIVAAALAPSGTAWAVADADGLVHVLSPAVGLATSLFGVSSMPALLRHTTEPWLDDGAIVLPDATARAADADDAAIAPLFATRPPTLTFGGASALATPSGAGANGYTPSSFAAVVAARAGMGNSGLGGVVHAAAAAAFSSTSGATAAAGGFSSNFLPPLAAAAAATHPCGLVTAPGGWHPGLLPWGACGETGPPHYGNALTAKEAAADTCFDSVLLQGLSAPAPVSSPGISQLGAPQHTMAWAGLWSASRAAAAVSRSDFWAPVGGGVSPPPPLGGRAGAAAAAAAVAAARAASAPIPWGTPSLIAEDMRSGEFAPPPAYDRASTFAADMSETVLVGPGELRREIDPALLTRLDRAGAYVDNRTLRLRPGALLHGRRKAFINADPRQRRPGRSTLEATGDDDSASISSADGDEAFTPFPGGGSGPSRGDGEGDGEDSDGGLEIASVSTATSVRDGPTARSARRARMTHVARAYRRPRLPVTKFGFFDTDFSRYCGSSPFCGLEDIGPNSLVNAVVQALFFTRTLRRRVSRHLCSHPACVACELRFVNDQLAMAPSLAPPATRAAAGSTLVRALAFVTEVRRQGILHGPSAPVASDPVRRMDALLRVMLDRIGRELGGTNADFEMPLLGIDMSNPIGGKSRSCPATAPPHAPKDPAVADAAAAAATVGSPAPEGGPDSLFGLRTTSLATCATGHTVTRESVSICVDLLAPPSAGATGYSFPAALGASLGATRKTRAWCEECRAYVSLVQARVATSAPPLLLINAGAAGASDAPTRAAWAAGSDGAPWVPPSIGLNFRKPSGPGEAPSVDVVGPGVNGVLPTGTAYVYELVGAIVHVRGRNPAGGTGTDGPNEQMGLGGLGGVGGTLGGSSGSAPASPMVAEAASPVPLSDAAADAASLAAYHYVAVLRVTTEGGFAVGPGADADAPPRAVSADAGPSAGWWVFNNFRITPTTSAEARNFSRPWKTPCTLIFQRIDHEAGVGSGAGGNPSTAAWASLMTGAPIPEPPAPRADGEPAPASALRLAESPVARSALGRARLRAGYLFPHPLYPSPLTADVFRVPPSAFTLPPSIPHQPLMGAAPPTAGHYAPEALPSEGDLAAIDAEFVVCAPERARLLPDGSRRLVAAARNMPGRVTVVTPERAAGDPVGGDEALSEAGATARVRVLMDEHAVATERVWDHLTRFSGINPGDLDTSTSPFRLHAYKASYLRLRALLDGGAVLVGHGLRKDARELNIFVPEAQAADTVRLWKLPQHRLLSLRFLASHLLGLDIQGNVHDSGEDALVALRLYQAWARVRAATGTEGVKRLTDALYSVGRASGFRAACAAAGTHATDAVRTPADVATAALVGAGVSAPVLKALGLTSTQRSTSTGRELVGVSANAQTRPGAPSALRATVTAPVWLPRGGASSSTSTPRAK